MTSQRTRIWLAVEYVGLALAAFATVQHRWLWTGIFSGAYLVGFFGSAVSSGFDRARAQS